MNIVIDRQEEIISIYKLQIGDVFTLDHENYNDLYMVVSLFDENSIVTKQYLNLNTMSIYNNNTTFNIDTVYLHNKSFITIK